MEALIRGLILPFPFLSALEERLDSVLSFFQAGVKCSNSSLLSALLFFLPRHTLLHHVAACLQMLVGHLSKNGRISINLWEESSLLQRHLLYLVMPPITTLPRVSI